MIILLSKLELSKKFLKNNSIIKCIYCNELLVLKNNEISCVNNHNFNIKRNGSIFLVKNNNYKISKFYNKELFIKRRHFILNHYYDDINKYINNFIKTNCKNGTILDIGCGEGSHTYLITEDLSYFNIYGIDYSKDAVDLATDYMCKNTYFLVGDVNNLPFNNNSIDIVIDYLSPFNTENVNKILKKDGYFIKVIPTSNYLIELRKIYNLKEYDNKFNNIEGYDIIENKVFEKKYNIYDNLDKDYLLNKTPLTWNVVDKNKNIDTITISLNVLILRKK